jgi:hypothetical protein
MTRESTAFATTPMRQIQQEFPLWMSEDVVIRQET